MQPWSANCLAALSSSSDATIDMIVDELVRVKIADIERRFEAEMQTTIQRLEQRMNQECKLQSK